MKKAYFAAILGKPSVLNADQFGNAEIYTIYSLAFLAKIGVLVR
ncbi:hypothetical protein ALT785_840052 [Alteromonas infernus]